MQHIRQALHTDIDALLGLQQQYWIVEHIEHFDPQRNRTMLKELRPERT